ncbi:DUF4054 domain-containing protein [Citrobacter portucalensis]|uniref:DUF4054 domain-containing protein n=1 Tax=Citrobacter portucalensis TaxID=1639133 RepID=UPI002432FE7C|nr:DUF4054 domain-containing protein [Citrobacter portucalensis]WFZ22214.1 DUF4054 domain-containing protein [Citrobacter portucalensis]
MATVKEWLVILLPGYTVDEGAICALSSLCARVYDLQAAVEDGYEETYLLALYIAANQGYTIEGNSGSIRPVASKKEGKVSQSYATGKGGSVKAGWKGTTFGIEFLDIMSASRGGGILLGSAS